MDAAQIGFVVRLKQMAAWLHGRKQSELVDIGHGDLERLRVFPEYNPYPVLEASVDGQVTYMNPSAKRVFGEVNVLSSPLASLVTNLDFSGMKDSAAPVSRGFEFDGQFFEARIISLGESNLYRIYVLDVTDRVHIERDLSLKLKELAAAQTAMVNLLEDERVLKDDLKAERDRANQIISSMGEGLLVIDKNDQVTIANPTAANLLKMRREDIIGKKWSELGVTTKSGDEVPVAEHSFYYAVKKGITVYTNVDDDHYYKTAAGDTFPVVSITAPLTSKGEIIGAVKVFHDATYEKESRAMVEREVEERTHQLQEAKDRISEGWLQLQQEKVKLTASINALPIGFFLLDEKHNVIVANRSLALILGIDESELSYDKVFGELGSVISDAANICPHCRGNNDEYEVEDVKYKAKVLRVFSVPVMKAQEYIGAAILVEDQTEEKMLERSKDEFFAIASHELRTPLTAIRGNTSLINEYFKEQLKDPNLKEIVDDMHESSIRLIEIVNDFLDVGQLEQGKVEFKKEVFSLVDLTREVYHDLNSVASQKGLVLRYEEPTEGLPDSLADQGKVKQIVTNLVGNSIKYTKAGEVNIGLSRNGANLKVMVRDTGIGISEANKRRLFGKFVQASESYLARDVTRGTGLGLYISRLLATGMGGKVYLESSELGRGSTFVLEVPAVEAVQD